MKRIFLVLLVAVVSCVCYGQRIKVYQGNNINRFLLSDVDSISFGGNEMKVYNNAQLSRFPVNNVDSVSIYTIGYYQIPTDSLNGWDEGVVTSDNYYFVIKRGENEDGYVAYMNDGVNSSLGLAIYYDNDFNVTGIASEKGCLFLDWDYDNYKVYVYSIDTSGEVVMSDEIELSYGFQNVRRARRKSFLSDIGQAIVGAGIVNDWAGRYNTVQDFMAGDWDAAIDGLGVDVAGSLIGGMFGGVPGAIIGLGIGECFNILNNRLKELGEKGVKMLLGDSQVKITNIKRTGIYSYKVTIRITGLDTRPTGSHWNNKQVDVKAGIYIRENYPTVTYNYKTSESALYPVNINGSYSIDINIEKPRGKYYIVPVLIPYSYGYPHTGNIRYGSYKLLEGEVVQISNIKQDRCTYFDSSKEYAVEASIDADIISLEGITSWGVEIYSLAIYGGDIKIIEAPSGKKSHTFKYQDFLSETYLDKTTNSFKLSAIPYAIGKSNDDKVYGKSKSFEIKVNYSCPDDHHPHAIDLGLPSGTKWCCCNVGASTPEGSGGYYAWGETKEKSVYNIDTYAYRIDWDNCQYIGNDIAGTSYDVARVRMGAPWRMPSHDQQLELMNNCSRQWTQQNGVNGELVTGPSGAQIFLPAAGYRWNDELINAGSYGYYWSSSLYPYYDYCAYCLIFVSNVLNLYDSNDRRNGLSVRAVRP